MRHIFLSLLFIGISVFGMEKKQQADTQRTQILAYVKSRIEQHCNEQLLAIARQTESKKIVENIINYYNSSQPKNQTSVWAYLKNPTNISKIGAYFQLLRESSIKVRETAFRFSADQLEDKQTRVDFQMFARTNSLWPLVSVQYELSKQADLLDIIHNWAEESLSNCNQVNHKESQQILTPIANTSQAVRNAITICKQTVEST